LSQPQEISMSKKVKSAPRAPAAATSAKARASKSGARHTSAPPPLRRAPRPSSKLAILLALLELPEGATLAGLVEATGWLPHSTRAALTDLRKRGYVVTCEPRRRDGDREASVYRIVPAGAK
jgi:hypothetical protein